MPYITSSPQVGFEISEIVSGFDISEIVSGGIAEEEIPWLQGEILSAGLARDVDTSGESVRFLIRKCDFVVSRFPGVMLVEFCGVEALGVEISVGVLGSGHCIDNRRRICSRSVAVHVSNADFVAGTCQCLRPYPKRCGEVHLRWDGSTL